MKLYRININNFEDPLQNESLLELVGPERRKKVIRYCQPDDRKRSLGAGIVIKTILNENGLSESSLKYSENEKPTADNLFFNITHSGAYVVGVQSDCEVGCDIEKIDAAPLEIAEHYFRPTECEYIKSAKDKNRAFFTLWTLKESYMKMTGRGLSIPLDSFEIIRKVKGYALKEPYGKPCFLKTMEFDDHVFSVCNETEFAFGHSDFHDIM